MGDQKKANENELISIQSWQRVFLFHYRAYFKASIGIEGVDFGADIKVGFRREVFGTSGVGGDQG